MRNDYPSCSTPESVVAKTKPYVAAFKKMTAICGIVLFVLFASLRTNAQVAGDYRSNAVSLNWSTVASWEQFDGTSWVLATSYPGQNTCTGCTVTIQNGHTVTLNVSPANSVGALVIGGGTTGTLTLGTFSLQVAGNLSVSNGATLNLSTGSLSVGGTTSTAGTVLDNSNTGTNTFTGLVTKTGGSWTSTSSSTSANLVFAAGFTNTAGTFSGGGVTFGAGATITATTAMSFNNTFTGQGALNVNGTTLTISAGNTAIAGNLTIGAGTTLNYNSTGTLSTNTSGNLAIASGATLTLGSTGSLSIAGTTTIDGTFNDNSNNGTNTFTGLITNNGTFNTNNVTTAGIVRINGGFTNNVGAVFNVTAVRLAGTVTTTSVMAIDGAITTNGAVTIAGGNISVTGASSAVFNSNLIVSSGASIVFSNTGVVSVAGSTNVAGSLTDNDNTTTTTFTGSYTNTGTTDFSALSTGNIVFNGGIVATSGTFNISTATISTAAGTDINTGIALNFSTGLNLTGTGTFTIGGTGSVTLSGTANLLVPAALTLNTGSSLIVSTTGNFTVTGTSTINGSFTDNENTGITSFGGLITKGNGAWNTTAVTIAANLVLNGGLRQTGGTFNAGAASLPTDQTITANPVATFNNPISISGTGNLTVAGNGGVAFAGTGDYIIPGNLVLTGPLVLNTTGNFTVTGTTSMTGVGALTDNNNSGISTFTGLVTHNSTGRWTTTAVTTAANLVLSNGFTNTAGTFSAGAATIGDAKTLTGTVNMSFANGIVVLGNADLTVAGTSTSGVTFGGTAVNYSFRNLNLSGRMLVNTSGNFTVSGTTTISGTGNFTDNNGTGITTFTGLVTVGSTATFTTTSVGTSGRMNFAGGIVQNNTTANAFSANSIRVTATQTWSGAGNINTTGSVNIFAGTLTNNITGKVSFNGTLTGTGTTWIQGTNAWLSLGSTNPLTITTLTATATGNTVEYRALGNATVRGQTYHHLIIDGSGNKNTSTIDIVANGNITINAGALDNSTNNRNIFVYGNWINNVGAAGFVSGTGTVNFIGTAIQTLGGTGATTFRNLTINNTSGINQNASSIVNGTLNLTNGVITTGTNTISISSTGSVNRTNGYINGNEQRHVATGSNVTRTFDVGAGSYAPVTLVFASVTGAGDVTVQSVANDQPNLVTSSLNSSLSINRYWAISNSATTFTTYNATFTFVAGDKDASINTANVFAGIYGSSWSYPTIGTRTATSTQFTGATVFGDVAIAESLPCSTPTLVITDPAALCAPATADLTAAAITSGSTAGMTFTYWTNALATISYSTPTAATAGTYYIKGTVSGGCSEIKPVVVAAINPTGVLSGTGTICNGQSNSVSVAVTGNAPWSGTLSDGTPFSGSVSPITVNVNPSATTTFTIATLNDAGCAAQAANLSGSASVTVLPVPTTSAAGSDQSTCIASVTLAANTPTVGTGSWSIVSGTGGSFVDATQPNTTFNGTSGETYVLRWTISNPPCTASTDDVTIAFTTGLWTGAIDNDMNNPLNWCGDVLPTGTIDLNLPAGLTNYPVISDNVIVGNLTIAAGANIAITATGTLTITGTYSNNGTLTNNGGIILNGSAHQSFPGATATILAMNNFEVDNSFGVTIDQSFRLTGTLTSTTGEIDLADKNITLVSDATNTARVAAVTGTFDYSGGGKFIVQRYIPAKRAWRLMTAPLNNTNTFYEAWQNNGAYTAGEGTFVTGPGGANGLDAAGSSSLKIWDVNTQVLQAVTNTQQPISTGTNGSADNNGYFIFIRGDRDPANLSISGNNVTTLSSAGRLQTGDQVFATATGAGKYALVGNPYASPVAFTNLTRTNLVNRFYVWDPTLNAVGGYVMLDDIDDDGTYSSSVVGSAQTSVIQSQQAFFVETDAAGTSSITFHENNKSALNNNAVFRPGLPNENISINLYLLNADNSIVLADGIKAEFKNNYSAAVNNQDALKFSNVNETFALARDGVALALERRPVIDAIDTLYLKLTRTTQRQYRFKINSNNLNDHGFFAVLKDNYLNTTTAISLYNETVVDFTVNADPASALANRFSVIFKPLTPLPVTFTQVRASQSGQQIAVDWNVANETNIRSYELEKSVDGVRFNRVSSQFATANNNGSAQYHWMDVQPFAGANFYRVKSIGINGTFQYSTVVKVNFGKGTPSVGIFPNPIQNNTIQLQMTNAWVGQYSVRLINSNGQTLHNSLITTTNGNATSAITIPQTLAKGVYQVEVKGANGFVMMQQVLVQ